MINATVPNYSGRQPNSTAYIKYFVPGTPPSLWTTATYENEPVITPLSQKFDNLYIPGNLYVDGQILNPSDIHLKDNIKDIDAMVSDNILLLNPKQFTFKNDPLKELHYGFIAQEFESVYPELVGLKPDKKMKSIKAINYLEIIPMLVSKIQTMQHEIDLLKKTIGQENR
jgi:hypothetical protein